jgi:hypothetical protein
LATVIEPTATLVASKNTDSRKPYFRARDDDFQVSQETRSRRAVCLTSIVITAIILDDEQDNR